MAEDNKFVTVGVSVAVAVAAVWYLWGGGLEKQAAKDLGDIEQQVAIDSVNEYKIAKRSGSSMDACVHAGIVAAAYLQANDEENYRRWKLTESVDCNAAGLPR